MTYTHTSWMFFFYGLGWDEFITIGLPTILGERFWLASFVGSKFAGMVESIPPGFFSTKQTTF